MARAGMVARLPEPLTTILNDASIFEKLRDILTEHDADTVVIGVPHGLSGQETEQTRYTLEFVKRLESALPDVAIKLQEEALSSVKAEAELNSTGKKHSKADIDALAAAFILEDYLQGSTMENV